MRADYPVQTPTFQEYTSPAPGTLHCGLAQAASPVTRPQKNWPKRDHKSQRERVEAVRQRLVSNKKTRKPAHVPGQEPGWDRWACVCLEQSFEGAWNLPFALWGCSPCLYLRWGLAELGGFRIPVSAVASLLE